MNFEDLKKIDPNKAKNLIPKNTGIYFWFKMDNDELIYIGAGAGKNGLYNRIVRQHLNPKYIEYRSEKHSSKDFFQLNHPIKKIVKGEWKEGIDQSAFRKNIGRKLEVKPGEGTVNYILDNFYLKYHEVSDVQELKEMENELIQKFKPKFNINHKYKISNRL